MDGSSEKKQLFGEGGFPGIGVGNNGKSSAAINLLL